MCGRYASFRQAQDLADVFDVTTVAEEVAGARPSWNVAPTQDVAVVVERAVDADGRPAGRDGSGPQDRVERLLTLARWGLVPHWAKDVGVGSRMINARSESVAEKASFKGPLRTSRCVVPADGYYEWQAPGAGRTTKTPHFVHRTDGAPLALAGLYSWWKDRVDDAAPWLLTCTILTRAAEGAMRELHDRVPVILDLGDDVDTWLDPALTDPAQALAVVATADPALDWHPVSTRVNTPRNNTPDLVEPAG